MTSQVYCLILIVAGAAGLIDFSRWKEKEFHTCSIVFLVGVIGLFTEGSKA